MVELRPLGEVCKTTSGGTPSRSKPHYFEGTIPWIKSGELPDGLVVQNSEYINDEAISNSSAKLLPCPNAQISSLQKRKMLPDKRCLIFWRHPDLKQVFSGLNEVR